MSGEGKSLSYLRQKEEGFKNLKFKEHLEVQFRKSFHRSRLFQLRIALLVGITFYLGKTIVDYLWPTDAHWQIILTIRIINICIALTLLASLRQRNVYESQVRVLLMLAIVVANAVVVLTYNIFGIGGEPGNYVGLIPSAIFVYCVMGLLFFEAVLCSLFVFLMFVTSSLVTNIPYPVFYEAVFNLCAANFVGALSSYLLEYNARTNFLNERILDDLREKASLESKRKSQFLAAANHDIRQPIYALELFVGFLEKHTKDPVNVEIVKKITGALNALNGVLSSLLDISKLDTQAFELNVKDVILSKLFSSLELEFSSQAKMKDIALIFKPTDLIIKTDPNLFGRILRNYISNAIKYTEEGRVVIGCRRNGNKVKIEVWDTGLGFEEEEKKKAFLEFTRLNNARGEYGLGLGLAIVSRLAKILKHQIGVDSTKGKGSVFWIEVPKGNFNDVEKLVVDRRKMPQTLYGRTVVLIDDDSLVVDAFCSCLNSWGCSVISGANASEIERELAKQDLMPDLIISDYHLGRSETGIEAIETVRGLYGDELFGDLIPGIIITGNTDQWIANRVKAYNLRIAYKPLDAGNLRLVINQMIKRQVRKDAVEESAF